MTTDLHKRLEEAAEKHTLNYVRNAFFDGAAYGYKEAIAQAKEYLEKMKDNYMRHREMWQQDTFEWGCYDAQINTIDEIINKLFKEDKK